MGKVAFFAEINSVYSFIPEPQYKNNQNCSKRIHPQYIYTLHAILKLVYFRTFSSSQMI